MNRDRLTGCFLSWTSRSQEVVLTLIGIIAQIEYVCPWLELSHAVRMNKNPWWGDGCEDWGDGCWQGGSCTILLNFCVLINTLKECHKQEEMGTQGGLRSAVTKWSGHGKHLGLNGQMPSWNECISSPTPILATQTLLGCCELVRYPSTLPGITQDGA